jgi:hypothetical protein
MMRFTLLFIGFLVLPNISFSQDILPMIYDTNDRKQEIIFNGSIELSATATSNTLLQYFVQGGDIPYDVRESNYNQQDRLNRVGFIFNPEFEYRNYCVNIFKKKNWGILVKAGTYTMASGRYSNGLFGLAFLGNEPFLGQEVGLSNSNYAFFSAHKLGFGLIDAKTKSSVSLNVYGIRNYSSGILNNAYLKQDVDGFNAEIKLDGDIEFLNERTYYKGIGVGLDANFILPATMFNRVSYIQFQLQNLGVGFLTGKKVKYEMDTTIQFTGYEVSDLIGDNAIINGDTDLLDEIGLKRDTIAGGTMSIPFTVQIGKIVDEQNRRPIQTFFGFRAIYQKGAIPQVYLGLQYRATNWLRIGASASYGGFSAFRVGLYANTVFKNFNAGIGTNNLIGIFSQKGHGQAFLLRLNYML